MRVGGEKMSRKISVIIIAILIVSMATITGVQAKPWDLKNNDKFETYDMVGTFSLMKIIYSPHEWIPSVDDCAKMTIFVDEQNLWNTYTLTIGTNIYHLGEDFIYTANSQWIFYQPIFTTNTYWPSGGYSQLHLLVDYKFTFLPASGIEGTINMQAVGNEGGTNINSLSGTDDLQNVQIKATSESSTGPGPSYIMTVHHSGIVSGWPN
jgi:hypothetical protein